MDRISPELILSAVATLQNSFTNNAKPEEVYGVLLRSLLEITKSRAGFIAEVQENSEAALVYEIPAVFPSAEPGEMPFSRCQTECLVKYSCSSGALLLANSPAELPSCLYAIESPLHIKTLFLLPIKRGEEVLAVLVLVNRTPAYQQQLVADLAPLSAFCSIIAHAYTEQRARNKTEQALRESQLQLRQVIDLVPHHIFAIVPSKGGRFIFANKSLAQVYGMPPEEVVGKTQKDITPVIEEEEHFLADDFEVINSGKMKFIPEEIYTDPFGKIHYLQTTKIPFKAVGSNDPAVLGICVDITDQKQLEEQRKKIEQKLQETQKLESLGLLAGGIAHDFNNILTGILGHASLALLDLPAGSPMRDRLSAIESSAQHAADLCQQLLAYSGKGKFEIRPVNLSSLVDEMLKILAATISKKAQIRHVRDEKILPIEADATQMRQVIINLITNASESLDGGKGVIEVRTGCVDCPGKDLRTFDYPSIVSTGPCVFLEVSDNGCGMDAETRSRIFDPFFSTKFTGRGLGLAAVMGIIRGHDGEIQVESQVGQGTTFKVFFPASPGAAYVEQKAAEDELLQLGGNILVVDDEEIVRSLAQAILERSGYKTMAAADGLEALALFRKHHSDICAVLLDMTMPHLSGEETFEELRKIEPNIPIVLSSGYSEQEANTRFFGRGLSGFIQKPYRASELVAKMKEAGARTFPE